MTRKLFVAIAYLATQVNFVLADALLDDFDGLSAPLPVVTSASRLTESVLKSPSAVTIIDKDMIAATGFAELADVFRLVPGFIVANYTGDTPTVISHGEGWEYPSRMQLLIDGRSTYTSSLSAIDWNTLGVHIEDIERIEVVRGPAASAYGSNSFAGAINIITKQPELDDKLHLRYRTGNAGEQEMLLRHSGSFNNLAYRVTASKRKNGGYEDYIETRVENPAISSQPQFYDDFRDDRDIQNLSLSTHLQLDYRNSFQAQFHITDGTIEMPNIQPETELFKERNRDVDAWSANVVWDHNISENQQLKVNFFHNALDDNDMTETNLLSEIFGTSPAVIQFLIGEPDQTIPFGIRSSHTHRSDLEVSYSNIHNNGVQYVVGTGIRYDTMSSEAFFPMDGTKTNTEKRFFANIQVPINDYITTNAGAFYEMNNIERPHFSPRASLNFHLNPRQSIRLGYSRAYRIPSLLEKHMNSNFYSAGGQVLDDFFVADSDLHAEQVTSVDLGYLGSLQAAPLSWEFKVYREQYRDSIAFYVDEDSGLTLAGTDDDIKRIGNVAQSDIYGFEGAITYRPEKNSFIRFHFNHGHMSGELISKINREPPKSPTDIRTLSDRAPDKVYGILVAKKLGTWQLSSAYYHVGKMRWDGYGDEVDSYSRIDATITKTIKLSRQQQLVFSLTGQNITNNDYNEFSTDTDLKFHPRYFASISFKHN